MKAKVKEVVELPNEVFLKEVEKLIAEGHDVTLRVRGVSMRPFLEDRRDKIVLTKTQNPKIGDAVLAEIEPGKYVFHRIVVIKGERVTLRGDGNISSAETCDLNDIVAVAKAFIRNGKNFTVEGMAWRCYSVLWPKCPLMRRVLLKLYRACRKVGIFKKYRLGA